MLLCYLTNKGPKLKKNTICQFDLQIDLKIRLDKADITPIRDRTNQLNFIIIFYGLSERALKVVASTGTF